MALIFLRRNCGGQMPYSILFLSMLQLYWTIKYKQEHSTLTGTIDGLSVSRQQNNSKQYWFCTIVPNKNKWKWGIILFRKLLIDELQLAEKNPREWIRFFLPSYQWCVASGYWTVPFWLDRSNSIQNKDFEFFWCYASTRTLTWLTRKIYKLRHW